MVGWCGEVRGGPTTVGQWTRCCCLCEACVKLVLCFMSLYVHCVHCLVLLVLCAVHLFKGSNSTLLVLQCHPFYSNTPTRCPQCRPAVC